MAQRDLIKFLRDRPRVIVSLVFPFIFIAVLGSTLQANLGRTTAYNLVGFTFTGVLAMTLFQSAATGIISLIEDRENDFSKEMFVAPIRRTTIIAGKVLGETLVALIQGAGIVAFSLVIGVRLGPAAIALLIPVGLACCLLGGAFGVATLGALPNQRTAQQIFPFFILPQYFLAGIFAPINVLPIYLDIVSHLSPLRYAVDLTRVAFYTGRPEYGRVVLDGTLIDVLTMSALFLAGLGIGTLLFTHRERNR
ncbi:ABC transporter permease [Candidatus Dormiibacter inghamiae]|uniref:ABC transporter permease n=1 Tax=Candidatus Dormiibacter inghamiae TaxID=3127013 RepID=UPI0030C6E6BA